MVALGMGIAVVGYGVGMWGYFLVRGYDISWREWWLPTWPRAGSVHPGTNPPGGPSGGVKQSQNTGNV